MADINAVLSRLEKVRRTGPANWIACCPAHDDKSPSMTIHYADDGRVLMHCFSGCSIESIIGAAALDWDDLFPDKAGDKSGQLRRPYPAADILQCIAKEAMIVYLVASAVAKGKSVSDEDLKRCLVAASRTGEAVEIARGNSR
jgi:hypothetical protein